MSRPSEPRACPLCDADGGALVWRGAQLRVIRADEPGFPAFYRVVWNAHVAEFSDLSAPQRQHCMAALHVLEQALRQQLQPPPRKINLAALGNSVAHLHWHVLARFDWDSHWPNAVWASPQRARDAAQEARLNAQRDGLERALVAGLEALPLAVCEV